MYKLIVIVNGGVYQNVMPYTEESKAAAFHELMQSVPEGASFVEIRDQWNDVEYQEVHVFDFTIVVKDVGY